MDTSFSCAKLSRMVGRIPSDYFCSRFPITDDQIWPALYSAATLALVMTLMHSCFRTSNNKPEVEHEQDLRPHPPSETTRDRVAPQLPREILSDIIDIYIDSTLVQLSRTVRDYRTYGKKPPLAIAPLALCSKALYQLTITSWQHTWATCGRESCLSHRGASEVRRLSPGMRIITANERCLKPGTDLSRFLRLRFASLDYHNAWTWDERARTYLVFKVVVGFPQSLTRLEVLHMHTPASGKEVIQLVSSCCPGLVELRLVRCTMFNNPSCLWWRQHDHDYMKDYVPGNVLVYAGDIVWDLRNLPDLQVLHLGHYMASIQVVTIHRTEHQYYHPFEDITNPFTSIGAYSSLHAQALQAANGGPPINMHETPLATREFWAAPCSACIRDFARPIENAERLAASILGQLQSLCKVSFANFLSEGRTQPSDWWIVREINIDSAPGTTSRWEKVDRVQTASYGNGTQLRVNVARVQDGGGLGRSRIFSKVDGAWRLSELV